MDRRKLLLFCGAVALYYWREKRKRLEALKKSAVLEGHTSKGFESVREACFEHIVNDREDGVQVCCFHKGEMVVNIHGGRSQTERLFAESLSVMFSSTKVMESLVVAMLVDRGHVKYDQSLKSIWPELQVNEKVTVADLMRHQAGLLTAPVGLNTLKDPDATAAFLEKQVPLWDCYDSKPKAQPVKEEVKQYGFQDVEIDPKSTRTQAYHAFSRGWYASELCRRVDPQRRTMAEFFEDEVAAKFRKVRQEWGDFFIGCPPDQQHRVAKTSGTTTTSTVTKILLHLIFPDWLLQLIYGSFDKFRYYELESIRKIATPMVKRGYLSLKGVPRAAAPLANNAEFRSIPMASVTGCGSAQSMAVILSEVACVKNSELLATSSTTILSQNGLEEGIIKGETLVDELLGRPMTYTNCGMASDRYEIDVGEGWYGWGGAGGSVTVFNPNTNSSFVYVPSKLNSRLYKARGVAILRAFKSCIEQTCR